MDKVVIKKLCVRSSLTVGHKPIYQPILITVTIPTDVTSAAESDDVNLTIDYAQLSTAIKKGCDDQSFPTLIDLVKVVNSICPHGATKILASQPRGYFRASSIGLELNNVPNGNGKYNQEINFFIRNLHLSTIIGVNPEERLEKQFVLVDLQLKDTNSDLSVMAAFVADLVEASSFLTVETLALHIVTNVQKAFPCSHEITVGVTKPKALTFAEGAGVEVTRCAEASSNLQSFSSNLDTGIPGRVFAYIAFGSNIEPRVSYITKALNRIHTSDTMEIVNTSFLYESSPMYYYDQDRFYNGVVKISTTLAPIELLQSLKTIESEIGRQKRFENGPREIDLDILLYGNLVLDSNELKIPHPGIKEREFVLRPLVDLQDNFIQTVLRANPEILLKNLLRKTPTSLEKVLPVLSPGPHHSAIQLNWNSKTFIMGILNISPDSFSEPGIANIEMAVQAALKMESDSVDVIDIGAVSRSPGRTEDLSTEDEIHLLTSLIRLLRQSGLKVPISVDVFKGSVAKAAIQAGANIINDIGMGTRDLGMISVAAELGVPIIFMHTRGSPADMHKYISYPNGVVHGVMEELQQVIYRALNSGIYRWNIIIDPGIGFAKTGDQNLEILQNLKQIQDPESPLRGYPILIGCSRKKFIGTLTGIQQPDKRGPGSMASTAASISAGADIIRVHDVLENIQVAKFSDAFWRK